MQIIIYLRIIQTKHNTFFTQTLVVKFIKELCYPYMYLTVKHLSTRH